MNLTATQLKHLFRFALSADQDGEFTVDAPGTGGKRLLTLLAKLDDAGVIALTIAPSNGGDRYHLTDRGLELLGKPSHVVKSRTLRWQYFTYKAFGRGSGHWLAQKGNYAYRIEMPAQPGDIDATRWLREWRVQRFDTLPPKKGAWCPAPTLAAAKRVCLLHARTGQWVEPETEDIGEDAREPDNQSSDEVAEALQLVRDSDFVWTPSQTNRDRAILIATVTQGWFSTYGYGIGTASPEWHAVSYRQVGDTAPERSACPTIWSSQGHATAACVYRHVHKRWPRQKLGPEQWLERNWRRRYDS